jgi:FAS-associated factor 2
MASSSVSLDSLTEDQQLALQQYTSVTDQELDAALPLLQKCQWNAQVKYATLHSSERED